jgi:hypothetical protein
MERTRRRIGGGDKAFGAHDGVADSLQHGLLHCGISVASAAELMSLMGSSTEVLRMSV